MPTFTGTLFSECLDKKMSIRAIIPSPGPSKEANIETKAPLKTLYLLHGWNGNHEDWTYYSNIVMLAEQNNLAVIMPDGENSFYANHASSAEYETYFAKELIEQTRFLFPLSDKREDTFIGGLSMGGYGALKLGFGHSDLFGKVFAFSSRIVHKNDKYFDLDDDSNFINQQIKAMFNVKSYREIPSELDIYQIIENASNRPDLLLACGEDDYLFPENQDLHEWLIEKGIDHKYLTGEGKHTWPYWANRIYDGIEFLVN